MSNESKTSLSKEALEFSKRKVQMRQYRLLLLLLGVPLSACTTTMQAQLPAPHCSKYLSERLKTPNLSAPLPATDTAGAWVDFGNKQSGIKELETDRAATIVEVYETCEDMYDDLVKQVTKKPWWAIL